MVLSGRWDYGLDFLKLKNSMGTSLVVQWLRLYAHNAGGPGFKPWSGN